MNLHLGTSNFCKLHNIGQKVYYIGESNRVTEMRISEAVFAYRQVNKDGALGFVFEGYKVDGLSSVFHHLNFYTDKRKALRHAVFVKVVGVSAIQWRKAIGVKTNDAVEILRRRYQGNPTKPAKKTELEIRCQYVGVYDILDRCRKNGGLIRRDIIYLRQLLIAYKLSNNLGFETGNLDLILGKLGIRVK